MDIKNVRFSRKMGNHPIKESSLLVSPFNIKDLNLEVKRIIKENPEILDKEVYFSKDKNGKFFLTFNKPNLKFKSLPLNLRALDNFLEEVKYNFPEYNNLKPAFKLNQETKNIGITLAKDWKGNKPIFPEQDFIVTKEGNIQEA